VGQLVRGCVLQVIVMTDTNSQPDLILVCHALINVNQQTTVYFMTLNKNSPKLTGQN
jgi:hypothetical protein